MALYFVQHGVALVKEEGSERSLSLDGEAGVVCVANHLKQHGVVLSGICHSGKLRAQQTAEVFSQILTVGTVTELAGMKPTDDIAVLLKNLEVDDIMFIGHLPHIEKVVSYILTGKENTAVVKFTNATVVCIEKVESEFYIDWVLNPTICQLE